MMQGKPKMQQQRGNRQAQSYSLFKAVNVCTWIFGKIGMLSKSFNAVKMFRDAR